LWLERGTYEFQSLLVDPLGTLALGGGEIVVHVSESLAHHGATTETAESSLVLGYLGTNTAVIDASFDGTVIAPNAELSIGATRNASFAGAFFAKVLRVQPGTSVEFAEP
jgi:hypothetical protein